MKRKTFEEWFKKTGYSSAHESSIKPLIVPMMNAFDAHSEYITHLEKQNEVLLEAIEQINNRYDLHCSSIVDEAFDKIKGMKE
jgi:hypothetical protein